MQVTLFGRFAGPCGLQVFATMAYDYFSRWAVNGEMNSQRRIPVARFSLHVGRYVNRAAVVRNSPDPLQALVFICLSRLMKRKLIAGFIAKLSFSRPINFVFFEVLWPQVHGKASQDIKRFAAIDISIGAVSGNLGIVDNNQLVSKRLLCEAKRLFATPWETPHLANDASLRLILAGAHFGLLVALVECVDSMILGVYVLLQFLNLIV